MLWLGLGMALMMLLAIAVVLVPYLSRQGPEQRQLNLALYKDRRLELTRELEQGLVDPNRFDELDSELKRSLLDDAEQHQGTGKALGWQVLLPGVLLMVVLSAAFYWRFGAWQQLSHWQEVMTELPSLAQKALRPEPGQSLTPQQMQDLALGIRTRLSQQDDTNAWVFLGRVGFALGQKELSVDAYQKALVSEPANSSALLGLAQVELLDSDKAGLETANNALKRLLKVDPSNREALLLQGFVAYQKQDYHQALSLWQTLDKALPEGDPRKAMVAARVSDARSKLQGEGHRLLVKIDVATERKANLPPSATLFVYAKAPQGGPPLAAVRLPLSRLPTEVELSDATSMIPGRSLADASSYLIGARISQSGVVGQQQAGDLSGEIGPVDGSKKQVSLILK